MRGHPRSGARSPCTGRDTDIPQSDASSISGGIQNELTARQAVQKPATYSIVGVWEKGTRRSDEFRDRKNTYSRLQFNADGTFSGVSEYFNDRVYNSLTHKGYYTRNTGTGTLSYTTIGKGVVPNNCWVVDTSCSKAFELSFGAGGDSISIGTDPYFVYDYYLLHGAWKALIKK